MATSAPLWAAPARRLAPLAGVAAGVAYTAGAAGLVGEAAIHVQQFFSAFSHVRWIGPLFLLNAAAIIVVLAGLALPRTRALAALAGVLISAVALGSLVISYGSGLFGWHEGGFRTPVAIAMVAEVVAVVFLAVAPVAALGGRSR